MSATETARNGRPHASSEPRPEVQMPADFDLGKALQNGMDALEKVFAGFAKAAQSAVGSEFVRNQVAGQWLKNVAQCLESTAGALQHPTALPAKAGELACYLEQLEVEVRGSKFEAQQAALQRRLQSVKAMLDGANSGELSAAEAKLIAEAAGYFHAAANSVMPAAGAGAESFTFTK